MHDKPFNTRYMGYSVRSPRYRLTDWVSFDPSDCAPHWEDIAATELYDHKIDPGENHNVSGKKRYKRVLEQLRKVLRQQGHVNWG